MYEYENRHLITYLSLFIIVILITLLIFFIALDVNYSRINKSLKEDNYSLRLNISNLKDELIDSRFDRDQYCKNLYEWR